VVVVRTITEDEVPAYTAAATRGFHTLPRAGDAEFLRPQIDTGRAYGVFDGDAIVGTARSFATPLTVPGPCELTAAAVTQVTVHATHRRRGALTELMRQQLDEVAGRDEPVAVLIASEAPIYGRFGYGAASENLRLEVDTRQLRFTSPPRPGRVRFVDAVEFRSIGPKVYERFRIAQVGAIQRDDAWWDAMAGINPRAGADPPGFLAVVDEPDGSHTGFAHYTVSQNWEARQPASTMLLQDLVTVTDAAYDWLWRLVTSTDLIVHITAPDRPAREPLRALIEDRRHVLEAERNDFLWARLLDVPTALASRRYRVADRIVFEVLDAFRPSSGGRFALDAGPTGATCGESSEPPDLTVTQSDLGACFLGSVPLWPAVVAGRVSEHRPGAAAAFDRLFALSPAERPAWCNTWF
jgi:predicted acetyltransferase